MNAKLAIQYFSLTAVLSLLLLGVFNVALDPFGCWGLTPRWDSHRSKKGLAIGKYHLLRREKCDWIILGTSRAEMGYDPQSPLFPTEDVCNLGLSGAVFREVFSVGMESIRTAHPTHIILTLDHLQFREWNHFYNQYAESLFNPQTRAIEYYGSLLFGFNALSDSIHLIEQIRSKQSWPNTSRGFRSEIFAWEKAPIRDRFFKRVRKTAQVYFSEKTPIQLNDLRLLSEFISECQKGKIDLIIVLNPLHSLSLDIEDRLGSWSGFEEYKRAIVEVVHRAYQGSKPVWDFSTVNDFSTRGLSSPTENAEPYFWEDSHFKSALGEEVLKTVLRREPRQLASASPFGIALTVENMEPTFQSQRHLYAEWRGKRDQLGFGWFEDALKQGEEWARNP